MQPSLLIVDDEADFLILLSQQLVEAGYQVETAQDELAALYLYDEVQPDMLILDIRFGSDERLGLDILKTIRQDRQDQRTPILMLTSLSTPDVREQVEPRSFDLGATDFVPKSIGPKGLLARIRSRLPQALRQRLIIDNYLEIDAQAQTVRRQIDGVWQSISLEPKEFRILLKLVQNPGRVIERYVLEDYFEDTPEPGRVLNRYISELRSKIEPNPSQPDYILTKRQVGYKFKDY
ncbi:MAG: response regulator transcription factor [Chloroflexota bacterium]